MGRAELVDSIAQAEGRTLVAEVVAPARPAVSGVTDAEMAAAFGADLIILNGYDTIDPQIGGLPASTSAESPLAMVKRLIGRPVGINLEPVGPLAGDFPPGRRATAESVERALAQGADFILLTGNPGTGVSNQRLVEATSRAKQAGGERLLLMAGRMHAAGVLEEAGRRLLTPDDVARLAEAGADVILLPSPGTVPGFTVEWAAQLVEAIHAAGRLALCAVGTCQEGADQETIRQIALAAKMTGCDLHHLGDCGYAGVAPPENIMTYSLAIRGRTHTYRRMASSPLR
ncbi:MAG: haloacid dehalogenase-like hydrolase [Firmicutes bacterium]|nr:haloacid dehalogenase-like hydrolase [Bacillota bacterium]